MTVGDLNRKYVVMQLVKKMSRKRIGNKRMNPSNLVSMDGPILSKPRKTRKQTTTSAKAGRKRAIPQRLVKPDRAKATLKKGN